MCAVIYKIVLVKQSDRNKLGKEEVHFMLQLSKLRKELNQEPEGRGRNEAHRWVLLAEEPSTPLYSVGIDRYDRV